METGTGEGEGGGGEKEGRRRGEGAEREREEGDSQPAMHRLFGHNGGLETPILGRIPHSLHPRVCVENDRGVTK